MNPITGLKALILLSTIVYLVIVVYNSYFKTAVLIAVI